MNLNEEQLAAVHHPIGQPACLIAGAGSGKTATLTERIRWLMGQGITPYRICCVTFTNKAAGELTHRLGFGDDCSFEAKPHVSTIHSLALNAIRKDPQGFGFPGRVTPMDDYDQAQMIKKLIELEPTTPQGIEQNPWRLLEKIGYHRARGVGFSDDYTDAVHEEAQERHGGYHAMELWDLAVWKRFETEKKKASLVDFDDMILLINKRAVEQPEWKSKLETRFQHVLVDESQDVSPIQWKFIDNLLSPKNYNLFAVGDLAQSIYSFQGAEPRLLKEFSEGWRGKVPILYRIARNHRSLPPVIRLANKINAAMTEVIPLKMNYFRGVKVNAAGENEPTGDQGNTRLIRSSTPSDVAIIIAKEIHHANQLKGNGFIGYKDNAILVRSAMQVRDLEGALVRFRIPYVVRGGKGLLQTEEIKDILSYFRLAVNHNDYPAFVRAISTPRRGVGDVAIEKLRDKADKENGGDLVAVCSALTKLDAFVGSMNQVTKALDDPAGAVEAIIRLFNYKEYIAKKYAREGSKVKTKHENIDRFLLLVKNLVADSNLSAEDLVFQLAMERPTDEDDDKGMVTISTIHCSPPDEPILTVNGNKPLGLLQSDVDRLYSYTPKCNQLLRGNNHVPHSGYGFSIKARPYNGDLVIIDTPESHTRVTPEHRLHVSFNDSFYGKWVVYLMRRGDWWRIGSTTSAHKPYKSGGVPGRLASEKADCGWILGIFDCRDDALTAEIKFQVTYGIPSICFEKWHRTMSTQKLRSIHDELRPTVFPRAVQLLQDKGLLLDSPLYRRDGKSTRFYNSCWFDTVAANLLDGYMVVPVAGQHDFLIKAPTRPRPMTARVHREHYEGMVLSLDVPKHCYYISGGIVVHNSAKGLEWRRVYVTNVVEGSIPHRFSMGSESELCEEKRLLYVAVTRARDSVALCIHGLEPRGPNTIPVRPSRFLTELGIT